MSLLQDLRQLRVNFTYLTRLYNMERNYLCKLSYKLIYKVLKPSALELVKVGLAAATTNETTCKAL